MPRVPKWLREVGWRTVVGALLLGGIIHILATIAVPIVSSSHALARLSDTLPLNRMVLLPLPAPGKQPLPFLAPDAFYAMCRYDISVDLLSVNAPTVLAGWTLSLHTPQGDNFYVMPVQDARRGAVSLTIVPSAERLGEFAATPRRINSEETQVASPSWQGLVVLRAPLKGIAWRAETEAALRRASCTPVQRG